ncbi:MAG TPA: ABC transporter ATP-binding protein [Verrucomicrobiae bacterium]|nr:ABC transporter ATP-binding protein [Verrucomicrobiae bacterium]
MKPDPNTKTSDSPAVVLQALTKAYNQRTVVDAINLQIPHGIFYGVVGPNGAGKTTTLSMVAGLLKPTSGTAFINGHDVWSDHTQAMEALGILMDGLSYPERLTARELLEYTGRLRKVKPSDLEQRVTDLLEVLELDTANSTMVVDFSTGMRKKIALGMALIHVPDVLILDEPFESIDPVSANAIEAVLRQFVSRGGTVILSSHVMAFVERLCDRLAIIVAGKVIAEGTVKEVAAGKSLHERFVELVETRPPHKQLEWL